MTIDELDFEYIDFCNKFNNCEDCKYDENYPCQLMFGYDKGRADAIDELVDAVCCHSAFTNMQKDAIRTYAEQLKEQKND